MSGHPNTVHLPAPEYLGPGKFPLSAIFAGGAIVGLIFSAICAYFQPFQFAYSWFFAFYYFLTISLGSFFWVCLHYACDSEWDTLARRCWENLLALFPVLMVVFIRSSGPSFKMCSGSGPRRITGTITRSPSARCG